MLHHHANLRGARLVLPASSGAAAAPQAQHPQAQQEVAAAGSWEEDAALQSQAGEQGAVLAAGWHQLCRLLRMGAGEGEGGPEEVPASLLQQQQRQQAAAAAAMQRPGARGDAAPRLGGSVRGGAAAGLYHGGSLEELLALVQPSSMAGRLLAPPPAPQVRLFHGVSSWAPGQLEGEVRSGAWGLADATPADIASTPPQQLWGQLVEGPRIRWL
jgi:hypothetical protein